MSVKLKDSDFKGAVWFAGLSEDSLAEKRRPPLTQPYKRSTPSHHDSSFPLPQDVTPHSIFVSEGDMVPAVRSSPKGSAGGPDSLRPQQLRGLINLSHDKVSTFLPALAAFSALVLEVRVPPSIWPFFF